MKNIIVLNGIHTSGKSTVGKYHGERGFDYLPEIATDLFKSGYGVGAEGGLGLQILLMQKECVRDEQMQENIEKPVIESWHTAVLAHSRVYGGKTKKIIEDSFSESIMGFDPKVIYLELNTKSIKKRNSKIYGVVDEKVLDFYKQLDLAYKKVFHKFSLNVCYVNAEDNIVKVCEAAVNISKNHLI